jgi:hypothetical protein
MGSVTSAIATSYKKEILQGTHLTTDTYKILLIKPSCSGTYDASMTNVGTPGTGTPSTSNVGTDEASGTGYTSGGVTLTGFSVSSSGTTAWLTFNNASWSSSTISAIGAIIYNNDEGGKVVAVLSFGGTVSDTNGTFTITMPTADASNALIRIA